MLFVIIFGKDIKKNEFMCIYSVLMAQDFCKK